MAATTLVEKQLDDTKKLVELLAQGGFEVAAAVWLQSTQNDKWYFYIVSPLVDSEGFTNAYHRLHPLIRAIPQLFLINPLGFTLIGTNDPIAQDALKAMRIYPGSPISWPGITLGGQSIEAAYIFRPAVVAA